MRTWSLWSVAMIILFWNKCVQASFSIFHPPNDETDLPFSVPPRAPVFKGNCRLLHRNLSSVRLVPEPDPTDRTTSNCILLPYDGTVSVTDMMDWVDWSQFEALVVYNPVNNTLPEFPEQVFPHDFVIVGKIALDLVNAWGDPIYLTMGTNLQTLSQRVAVFSSQIMLSLVFLTGFLLRYAIRRQDEIVLEGVIIAEEAAPLAENESPSKA